jgi:hypothetical protein
VASFFACKATFCAAGVSQSVVLKKILSPSDLLDCIPRRNGGPVVIDGQRLSIAEVIAVARHAAVVHLKTDSDVRARVNATYEAIQNKLAAGKSVYGLTTGPLNLIRNPVTPMVDNRIFRRVWRQLGHPLLGYASTRPCFATASARRRPPPYP